VSPGIGTLEWADRTGGRLSTVEKLRLLGQGLRLRIGEMAPWRRRRVGLDQQSIAMVELPERPPDSPIAREAEELCRELSSETLLNHCLRTFVWGALLGQRDDLHWDDEMLYVAAMLHDLGLTDRHRQQNPDAHCFAVEGARAAADFASQAGWGEDRRDELAEAICLHINPIVGVEHGAEAHLLFRGAGCDLIGRDLATLERPMREGVLGRYPRVDMKREFGELMRAESESRPEARVHLYCRYGAFLRLIARAPFND
jgi:hypothetical protein